MVRLWGMNGPGKLGSFGKNAKNMVNGAKKTQKTVVFLG